MVTESAIDASAPPSHGIVRILAVGIVTGLVSGALMVAAIAPVGIWPLILVGLVPMIVAQHSLLPRRWCWIPVSITAYIWVLGSYSQIFWDSKRAWALLAPLAVAAVAALVALADRVLADRTAGAYLVLQLPVMWTGLDALRQNFTLTGTGGFPACTLSYQPRLIQPVSIFGISGLCLLILMTNSAIALALIRYRPSGSRSDARPSARSVTITLSVVTVAVAAWALGGSTLYDSVARASGAEVRVAAVQPGSLLATLGRAPTPAEVAEIQNSLAARTRLAAAGGAKLVVWPEEVLPGDPTSGPPALRTWFTDLLAETGVYVVTGFIDFAPDGSYENRAGLFAPDGKLVGSYTKAHHAPFDNDTFPVGTSFPSYRTPIGTIGMVICFDYDFPYTTRSVAMSGADILAVPEWQFGRLGRIAEQQKLIFRAVESRVPAVSADLAWTSIIVTANGRVVAETDHTDKLGSPGLLIGDVRLGPRDAPAMKLGNWAGTFSIAGTLGLLVGAGLLFARDGRRRL